ncbi:hypothetical protein GC177_09815 [bacterium]|nr:hypothetical protein [bacterium]
MTEAKPEHVHPITIMQLVRMMGDMMSLDGVGDIWLGAQADHEGFYEAGAAITPSFMPHAARGHTSPAKGMAAVNEALHGFFRVIPTAMWAEVDQERLPERFTGLIQELDELLAQWQEHITQYCKRHQCDSVDELLEKHPRLFAQYGAGMRGGMEELAESEPDAYAAYTARKGYSARELANDYPEIFAKYAAQRDDIMALLLENDNPHRKTVSRLRNRLGKVIKEVRDISDTQGTIPLKGGREMVNVRNDYNNNRLLYLMLLTSYTEHGIKDAAVYPPELSLALMRNAGQTTYVDSKSHGMLVEHFKSLRAMELEQLWPDYQAQLDIIRDVLVREQWLLMVLACHNQEREHPHALAPLAWLMTAGVKPEALVQDEAYDALSTEARQCIERLMEHPQWWQEAWERYIKPPTIKIKPKIPTLPQSNIQLDEQPILNVPIMQLAQVFMDFSRLKPIEPDFIGHRLEEPYNNPYANLSKSYLRHAEMGQAASPLGLLQVSESFHVFFRSLAAQITSLVNRDELPLKISQPWQRLGSLNHEYRQLVKRYMNRHGYQHELEVMKDYPDYFTGEGVNPDYGFWSLLSQDKTYAGQLKDLTTEANRLITKLREKTQYPMLHDIPLQSGETVSNKGDLLFHLIIGEQAAYGITDSAIHPPMLQKVIASTNGQTIGIVRKSHAPLEDLMETASALDSIEEYQQRKRTILRYAVQSVLDQRDNLLALAAYNYHYGAQEFALAPLAMIELCMAELPEHEELVTHCGEEAARLIEPMLADEDLWDEAVMRYMS